MKWEDKVIKLSSIICVFVWPKELWKSNFLPYLGIYLTANDTGGALLNLEAIKIPE